MWQVVIFTCVTKKGFEVFGTPSDLVGVYMDYIIYFTITPASNIYFKHVLKQIIYFTFSQPHIIYFKNTPPHIKFKWWPPKEYPQTCVSIILKCHWLYRVGM